MSARKRLSSAHPLRRSLALVALAAMGAIAPIGLSAAQAETVVFTPITLPTISGTATEGEVLTEGRARWSAPPVSYTVQWQRCDAKGKNCQSISKATASTYRLEAADVGSTIRVSENARNTAGAVTPVVSEPTAVVQVHSSGGNGGGGGEKGGGGGQPGPHGGPSAAELERLLARQLVPSGKAASLTALRRRGGLNMRFTLPASGVLTVKWYLAVPQRAGGAKSKAVLVATGRATLTTGKAASVKIRLTVRGRRLLAHSHKLKLRAQATFAVSGATTVSAAARFSLAR